MSSDITNLLRRAKQGDRSALDDLIPAVYAELRRLAARQLSSERAGHTLQPTALVNEAYLRLFGDGAPDVKDRRHFAGIAARVMRQVLVDYARTRSSLKRNGGLRVELERARQPDQAPHFLVLNAALDRLNDEDPALARLVEMRYFGGLSAPEIADLDGESVHIVRHNLRYAHVWLRRDMERGYRTS